MDAKKGSHLIYQFKITLQEIEPTIWRQIQVPATYSFWDLHVAVADSMGWLDYHLHMFHFRKPHKRSPLYIGIPDDEFDDIQVLPGWEIGITEHFFEPGITAVYQYDFGDNWLHDLLLEGILLKEQGVKYPRCIAGKRACPPEDCGGVPGYYRVLEILDNPDHEEYQETAEWARGQTRGGRAYRPDKFDPEDVNFDNPKKRWKIAFSRR